MFKKLCFLLILVSFWSIFGSCNKDTAAAEHQVICFYDQDITWNNYVRYLVQNSCAVAGCHVAGNTKGIGDYSTYAGIRVVVEDSTFEKTVLVENRMPKGSKLTTAFWSGSNVGSKTVRQNFKVKVKRQKCRYQKGCPEQHFCLFTFAFCLNSLDTAPEP